MPNDYTNIYTKEPNQYAGKWLAVSSNKTQKGSEIGADLPNLNKTFAKVLAVADSIAELAQSQTLQGEDYFLHNFPVVITMVAPQQPQ